MLVCVLFLTQWLWDRKAVAGIEGEVCVVPDDWVESLCSVEGDGHSLVRVQAQGNPPEGGEGQGEGLEEERRSEV